MCYSPRKFRSINTSLFVGLDDTMFDGFKIKRHVGKDYYDEHESHVRFVKAQQQAVINGWCKRCAKSVGEHPEDCKVGFCFLYPFKDGNNSIDIFATNQALINYCEKSCSCRSICTHNCQYEDYEAKCPMYIRIDEFAKE